MNDIPLVKDNGINAINISLIAAKKSLQLVYSTLDNVNKTFKDINKEIDAIDAKFADYLLKDDVVNSITDNDMRPVTSNAVAQIAPVDTVASGNLHSVTSNAVFNLNSTNVIYNYSTEPRDVLSLLSNCANRRISFIQIGGTNISNAPNGTSDNVFNYVVFKTENYFSVTAYDLNSNNVYQNSCQNGTWRSWERIWLEQTIPLTEIIDTTGHIHVFYTVKNGICKLRIDCEDQLLTAGSYTITGIPRCLLGTSAGGNILSWGSQIQGYFLVNSDSLTVVPTVSNQNFTGNFVYTIA